MKVAIIGTETAPIPPLRGGAVQIGIWEIAPLLAAQLDELYVLSPFDPELPPRETVAGAHHLRLRFSSHLGWQELWRKNRPLSYARAVAAQLQTLQPDIVHIRNRPQTVPIVRAALGERTKIVLHLHNPMRAHDLPLARPGAPALDCDALAACSRFLLESQLPRAGLPAEQGWVIYNGVNSARFRPVWETPAVRRRLRAEHGLAEDDKVVLFAGRLHPSKGIHHLLEAMEIVCRSVKEAKLVIAGAAAFGRGRTEQTTQFTRRLTARIAALSGKAIMLGFVPPAQMPELFGLADLFAGPSVWEEPFGLVFLEAQAAGLPVVATRRGGIPEVVEDGVTGLLVDDPSRPEILAQPIVRLLQDAARREQMGREGRARAERFTWRETAAQTLQLYRRLMEGGLATSAK